ncbi:MAG: helix-turn-helix domain-containing protein [Anaerolineales bacterium]
MPRHLHLRELTKKEEVKIRQLANSDKNPTRLSKRAQIIVEMLDDPELTASTAGLRANFKSLGAGPTWVKRFNQEGIAGLRDRPRAGRDPIHGQEVWNTLAGLAIQNPDALGYPFTKWTLARLQLALEKHQGACLAKSTIWTWLKEAGFKWNHQQRWVNETEHPHPTSKGKQLMPLARLATSPQALGEARSKKDS